MRRRVAPILLALACAASHAGCTRGGVSGPGRVSGPGGGGSGGFVGGDAGVDALVPALKAFTDELAARVESAADTKAGVAEAQRLLDSRRGELAARIDALKKSPQMRDAAARGKWLEAEVDNTQRVRELQLKYLDASMRDPGLKAGLERLAADYDSMFKDR
jgi:hypothetical protein